MGSQVQLSKIIDSTGAEKITNRNVERMGPVQLRIEDSNLYQGWERSRRSEIEGEKDQKFLETWVCRPPNILMFQINRVNYDFEKKKLVKDNSRFEFDRTIYLDLFLKANEEKALKHRK